MKQTSLHALGLNYFYSPIRPLQRNYNLLSYSDKLHPLRTPAARTEKAIILLAMLVSKKQLRIVLADDDEDDRELFAEAIAEHDQIHMDTVEDGIKLMKMLNSSETVPDIIFLDLNMPGKSGKKCLEEIRNNKKLAHIRVVIYSTSSSIKDIDDTFLMGANLYIRKPNLFLELTEVVKNVFSLDWNEYKPKTHKKKFVFSIKPN